MIKVSRKTHQTGFIILSFRLSTEMFFLSPKCGDFLLFPPMAFLQLGFGVKWEYSLVCSSSNGLCQRQQYIFRFSFCLENNIKTYVFCEMLYFSYAEISLKNKKEQWFDILEGANPIYIFFELVQFVLLILISPSCFFAPGPCNLCS